MVRPWSGGFVFPSALLLVFAAISAHALPQATEVEQLPTTQDARPSNCRVTLPSDGRFTPRQPFTPDPDGNGVFSFWFGTDKLWTALPTDGIWRGLRSYLPGGSTYRQKIFWYRMNPGFAPRSQLTQTAQRLDGTAPVVTDTFEVGPMPQDRNTAFVSAIDLPTTGCWEITGDYRGDAVTFVIWVTAGVDARSAGPFWPQAPRILVNGSVQALRIINKVPPQIPDNLKNDPATSGTVVLHVIIAMDGVVKEIQWVSGPQLLKRIVMDAVRQWTYKPTTIQGRLVEVDTTIELSFPSPS